MSLCCRPCRSVDEIKAYFSSGGTKIPTVKHDLSEVRFSYPLEVNEYMSESHARQPLHRASFEARRESCPNLVAALRAQNGIASRPVLVSFVACGLVMCALL